MDTKEVLIIPEPEELSLKTTKDGSSCEKRTGHQKAPLALGLDKNDQSWANRDVQNLSAERTL